MLKEYELCSLEWLCTYNCVLNVEDFKSSVDLGVVALSSVILWPQHYNFYYLYYLA